VIRPLIRIPRSDIEAYLREHGIEARTDHTNVAPDFTRNRIRESVLPVLEREVNPAVVEVLARDAEIFSEIDHRLTTEAREALETLAEIAPSEVHLDVSGVHQLDRVLLRAILREAILRVKGDLRNISHQHIDALLHLCLDGQSGKSIDLPGGTTAERVFDHLHLKRAPRPGMPDDEAANVEVEIDPASPEEVRWNRYRLVPEILEPVPSNLDVEGTDARNPEWDPTGIREAYFDLDALRPPLKVRGARPGDRLAPFGMEGHKKVFDLLMESRVPRGARPRVPVIEDAEGILWVVGVRRSDRAPLKEGTRRALKLAARETDRDGGPRDRGPRGAGGGRRGGGRRDGGHGPGGRRRS
jgi:tRNA(Ile)-lysidine synthase